MLCYRRAIIAFDAFESALDPMTFFASTLNVYEVPEVSPEIDPDTALLSAVPVLATAVEPLRYALIV